MSKFNSRIEANRRPTTEQSRREFMKLSGGCAALGSTSILSQLLSLQLTGAAMADTNVGANDYKALVCVFLLGGIDSFNVLTPYDGAEYNDYVSIRGGLISDDPANPTLGIALPRDGVPPAGGPARLLQIDGGIGGRNFGLHPAMSAVKTLYDSGNLAFIANVGSLIEPTASTTAYPATQKPLGLFSHADLQQHWQSSRPQSRSQASGWGGRMADLLNASTNSNPNVSMNLAIGSLNLFQTGTSVVPYVVGSGGATTLSGYLGPANNLGVPTNKLDRIHRSIIDQVYPVGTGGLDSMYSDLLHRTMARNKRLSIDAAQEINDLTVAALPNDTFGTTGFGNSLRMVAKLIQARSDLGHGRQIFFVGLGGWDNHDFLINAHNNLLPQLSNGLSAFQSAMTGLGVADNVTLFTASDFGRRLKSNGDGSDHAWGGNQMVMGGAVNGTSTTGKVYGDYPASLKTNNLDLGNGVLIPTTSVDEYNAELALWFGVPNDRLEDVLPNIRNFYGAAASTGPIGFLP